MSEDTAPQEQPQEQPSPEQALEARLAALVATQNQQEVATKQIDANLSSEIEQIKSLLGQLVQPAQPTQIQGPPNPATSGLFGSLNQPAQQRPQAQAQPQLDPNSLNQMIQQAVQQAVSPLQETLTQAQRQSQHERAFNQIASTFPDLQDGKSQMSQTFDKIWNTRTDLHALPDAVGIVAEIANSLTMNAHLRDKALGDAKAKTNPAAKAAPNSAVPPQTFLPQPSDSEEAGKLINELAGQGKDRVLADDEMSSLIGLAIAKRGAEALGK